MRPSILSVYFLWVAAALFLSTACSITPLAVEAPQPSASENDAVIYLFRIGQGPEFRFGTVPISVDGQYVFSVKHLGYTWIYLKPGLHEIRAAWKASEKPIFEGGHFEPSTLILDAKPGQTYYVDYSIDQVGGTGSADENAGLIGKAFSKSHVTSAGLIVAAPNLSKLNLQVCSFQANTYGGLH